MEPLIVINGDENGRDVPARVRVEASMEPLIVINGDLIRPDELE